MAASTEDQHFSLCWNDYKSSLTSALQSLRNSEEFVDVTLSCEGKRLPSHRILLSACSPYFCDLLKANPCPHPIIILRETRYRDLESILEFIYQGAVSVAEDQLDSFLQTAESLLIRGFVQEVEGADQTLSNVSSRIQVNGITVGEATLSGKNIAQTRMTKGENARITESPEMVNPTGYRGESSQQHQNDDERSEAESDDLYNQFMEEHNAGSISPNAQELDDSEVYKDDIIELDEEEFMIDDIANLENSADEDDNFEEEKKLNSPIEGNRQRVGSGRHRGGIHHRSIVRSKKSSRSTSGSRNKRGFACSYCSKVFKFRNSLGAHMALHQGKTVCSICGKMLSRVTNLRQHLISIHGVSPSSV